MNDYLVIFGAGTGTGIAISIWFCQQLSKIRTPRYYRRRARSAARSGLR